jgi:hypothetical protein
MGQKLGKYKEDIATAIAKIGDNAETVMKELRAQSNESSAEELYFHRIKINPVRRTSWKNAGKNLGEGRNQSNL